VLEQSVVGACSTPGSTSNGVRRLRYDAPGDLAPLADELPLVADGVLPRSGAELAASFRRRASELEVRTEARATVRFLRSAPVPRATRIPYRTMLAGAAASLPPGLAAALGMQPTPTTCERRRRCSPRCGSDDRSQPEPRAMAARDRS
jgi:hypothetical protein